MPSLKELNTADIYFPPKDNVITDFFIPALKCCTRYDRATGFFTSSALIEVSVGVCDLAKRGGKIRVITSPRLYPDDVKAIRLGYERKQVIGDSMIKHFEEPDDSESLDRLALLAELISKGILEMKIAVMKNLDDYPDAMFHPKFGVLYDSNGDRLAFTGSMNASKNGLGGNWDHISVESTDSVSRINHLERKFDDLWNGKDETVEIMEVPKVAKDLIDSYKRDKSMLNIDEILLDKYGISSGPESVFFKSPEWLNKNKRDYQELAIEKWIENGYRGIFDMATGTGKTKTALRALERLYNNATEPIFTVIVAPQKHLVNQWAEEVMEFGVIPTVGHSDSKNRSWKDTFSKQVLLFKSRPKNQCIITTVASFSTTEFQNQLSTIPNLAVVIDEAHNMGSDNRLKKLPESAKYRLALSATMERYKDKTGTTKLKQFFGEDCIHFSLEDAIGKYLVNYNYHPIICYYNDSDYSKFISSNEKLDSILNSSASDKEKKAAKNEYLQYTYTLNARMDSKFTALEKLMKNYLDDDHFLVYSGKVKTDSEGDYDKESHEEFIHVIDKTIKILGMNGLGLKVSRITYRENASDRRRIIHEFDKGQTQGIVAISCLDEGVDIPSIKTAVIMSSSDNPREYIQRRGRVLRMNPGKDYADIFDMVVLPKTLANVEPDSVHAGLELKLIAKEIRRMQEFAKPALNSNETINLFNKISSAYHRSIEEIIDVFGEEVND